MFFWKGLYVCMYAYVSMYVLHIHKYYACKVVQWNMHVYNGHPWTMLSGCSLTNLTTYNIIIVFIDRGLMDPKDLLDHQGWMDWMETP